MWEKLDRLKARMDNIIEQDSRSKSWDGALDALAAELDDVERQLAAMRIGGKATSWELVEDILTEVRARLDDLRRPPPG
jgi:hypothetical protein